MIMHKINPDDVMAWSACYSPVRRFPVRLMDARPTRLPMLSGMGPGLESQDGCGRVSGGVNGGSSEVTTHQIINTHQQAGSRLRSVATQQG